MTVSFVEDRDLQRSLASADLIVVGAGLFGATIAEHAARLKGKRVVLIDRRDHIAGNVYSFDDPVSGVHIHKYGPHIFHTSNVAVEEYVKRFASFNNYRHHVFSNSGGQLYSMPINLHTLSQFFHRPLSPDEAKRLLPRNSKKGQFENFEEAAVGALGKELYEAFIQGYTAKQWQEDPRNLPASVFSRLPLRLNHDSRYFEDAFEGIPVDGYTALVENMLSSDLIEVGLAVDFFHVEQSIPLSTPVVYSGPIDEYFGFQFGRLKWRTLDFEWSHELVDDFQGAAQVNFADLSVPWTRIVEYRHFASPRQPRTGTVISREFSRAADSVGDEPYYPVRTPEDVKTFQKYRALARGDQRVVFGGRLGNYAYFDMDMTIASAMGTYHKALASRL